MADSAPLRGYGPGSSRYNRLQFDGDERKFELWYTKFMGYLKLRNLKHVVDGSPPPTTATATAATTTNGGDGGGTEGGTNTGAGNTTRNATNTNMTL